MITASLQAQVRDSLMLYCTFDDVNSITNPVAGPGGTFNADPVTNFTTGQVGNAYYASYYESDLVSFPIGVLPARKGCIEFWGRLFGMSEYVNDGWGHAPAFCYTTNGEYEFEFNGNNGMGGSGLCGRVGLMANGWQGSVATGFWLESHAFSSILGDVNAWHHYALVWDIDGISGYSYSMQLFIDGLPVGSCNLNNEYYCMVVENIPTSGSFNIIAFEIDHGSVAIDELKVWNYAKTQFIDHAYIYTVLNDQQICKNDSTSFEVKAVGIPPINYKWQKDGVDISGATDSILAIAQVQPEDAGEYRCIASNSHGIDTSNTATLWVEFAVSTSIQGFTNVLEYQVETYSVEMQQGHTYEFIAEGGNRIDGTENSITVHWGTAGQGFVKLVETSDIGCDADTNTLNVIIGSLSVEESAVGGQRSAVRVFPNPTGGIVNLQFTLYNLQSINLKIYNAQGQEVAVVLNEKLTAGEHTVRWDAEGLPAGIYFYRLTTDDYRLTTGKLVLK
jgi:hypothetical protein